MCWNFTQMKVSSQAACPEDAAKSHRNTVCQILWSMFFLCLLVLAFLVFPCLPPCHLPHNTSFHGALHSDAWHLIYDVYTRFWSDISHEIPWPLRQAECWPLILFSQQKNSILQKHCFLLKNHFDSNIPKSLTSQLYVQENEVNNRTKLT